MPIYHRHEKRCHQSFSSDSDLNQAQGKFSTVGTRNYEISNELPWPSQTSLTTSLNHRRRYKELYPGHSPSEQTTIYRKGSDNSSLRKALSPTYGTDHGPKISVVIRKNIPPHPAVRVALLAAFHSASETPPRFRRMTSCSLGVSK